MSKCHRIQISESTFQDIYAQCPDLVDFGGFIDPQGTILLTSSPGQGRREDSWGFDGELRPLLEEKTTWPVDNCLEEDRKYYLTVPLVGDAAAEGSDDE